MECVRYEWKKFIAFRFFWLLCVVAFLFNLWNLSELAKMSWPPAEAVKELYADLKRQPEEERERWLKELKENKISSYTGNPYAEEELYKKVLHEYVQAGQYESYLDEIEQKSTNMSSAIFSEESSFAYRNAQKTPEAFEKLHGLELAVDISDGVIFAAQTEFTDVCMVLLLTAMTYFLVIYEKKNQLYRLLKSTYKGRKYVIRAKLLIAAGITCFLVLFLYGGNYLFSMHQYGFGDLERPVQSVTAMYESPYMLSVGEYLMLYLLLKMFVCYVIALAMMWLAQKAGSSSGAVLGIGFIGIGEYLLCLLLPSVSYMDVLKYVNLAKYIKVYPLLSQYHNLDVFGYPVNAMHIFLALLPVCLLLLLAVNIRKFSHCDKVKARWRRKKPKSVPAFVTDKLCLHELFKNLFTNKTIWLCAAVLYGAVLVGNGMKFYKDVEEEYYQMYVAKQQGHITEDKLKYFSEEKKKYEEIMALTPEKSGLSEQEIAQKQNNIRYPYAGFRRAYAQLQYVVGNNSMRGVNEQELVYDTGYEKMFGSSLARSRLILLSLCVFVAVYSASSALGMEYDLKVMNLLRSTKRGRLPILTTKIGTVFKITFLMAVLIHLPFILKIVKSYPMDNWGAKVRFMPFAGESVLNCTIGEYVFLLALSQFLSLFVIALAAVALSALLKDTILTNISGIVIFIGPLVMEWGGLYKIHFWSMNALLDAHQLLQGRWDMIVLQVLVFWIYLPAASCYILYEIYDKRK